MLSDRQQAQLKAYTQLIADLMHKRTKGSITINLVGNGELGTQVKIDTYQNMPKSLTEDELAEILIKKEG